MDNEIMCGVTIFAMKNAYFHDYYGFHWNPPHLSRDNFQQITYLMIFIRDVVPPPPPPQKKTTERNRNYNIPCSYVAI